MRQYPYQPLTDSMVSGRKVISPAVVTHTALLDDNLVSQTERDPPLTLLGDNPAGQVAVKSAAQ